MAADTLPSPASLLSNSLTTNPCALYLVEQQQLLQYFSLAFMQSQLSVSERQQSRAYRLRSRQQEFICGRFLIRLALSVQTGQPLRSHRLQRGLYDKPQLAARHGLQFNLAHSDGMLALVLCRKTAVGIDLEQPAKALAPADRRFFSPAELQWLSRLSGEQLAQQQCRLWTIKEAVLKALGLGLNCPPAFIDTTQLQPDGLLRLSWAGQNVNVYISQLKDTEPVSASLRAQGYMLSIARLSQPPTLCWQPLTMVLEQCWQFLPGVL